MPKKTQQLTAVVKGDFTFLFDSVKFQGESRERARGVSGRLVEKWKNVEKSKIPDPLMGEIKALFPYNVMDKGHIIARELGGPNIPENVVPMYGYFNRRGMWKAKERQLGEAIDEAPFVAIMIDYLAGGRLPNTFRIKTSSSRIDIPFAGSDFGNTVEMKLYAPAAYFADPVIAERIEAVLPAVKPSDKPYEFMDSQRKAWGLRDCLETEKFNADEREYIRVANSLFSRKSQPAKQQGFLFSDDPDDPYNVLNYMGNEDFSRGRSHHSEIIWWR